MDTVCSDEGLTLETSAKHHIPQAKNTISTFVDQTHIRRTRPRRKKQFCSKLVLQFLSVPVDLPDSIHLPSSPTLPSLYKRLTRTFLANSATNRHSPQTAVRVASSNEESAPPAIYHAIMRGLERLVVSFALSTAQSDSLVKLSVDRSVTNCRAVYTREMKRDLN